MAALQGRRPFCAVDAPADYRAGTLAKDAVSASVAKPPWGCASSAEDFWRPGRPGLPARSSAAQCVRCRPTPVVKGLAALRMMIPACVARSAGKSSPTNVRSPLALFTESPSCTKTLKRTVTSRACAGGVDRPLDGMPLRQRRHRSMLIFVRGVRHGREVHGATLPPRAIVSNASRSARIAAVFGCARSPGPPGAMAPRRQAKVEDRRLDPRRCRLPQRRHDDLGRRRPGRAPGAPSPMLHQTSHRR